LAEAPSIEHDMYMPLFARDERLQQLTTTLVLCQNHAWPGIRRLYPLSIVLRCTCARHWTDWRKRRRLSTDRYRPQLTTNACSNGRRRSYFASTVAGPEFDDCNRLLLFSSASARNTGPIGRGRRRRSTICTCSSSRRTPTATGDDARPLPEPGLSRHPTVAPASYCSQVHLCATLDRLAQAPSIEHDRYTLQLTTNVCSNG
jgi:hypothetical protein